MYEAILIAGFGGQGVLSAGQLLAYAGMLEGKHVSWIPSYGPEMRGGTANCGVTIADTPISSPVVSEPTSLIVMNRPSLEKFESWLVKDGLLLVNSSLIDIRARRNDIRVYYLAANELAEELGSGRVASMIMIGALLALTGIISQEAVIESLKKVLPVHRYHLLELNRRALMTGAAVVQKTGEVLGGSAACGS